MAVHRLVWRFSSFPMPVVKVDQRPPVTASMYSTVEKEMLLSNKSITTPADDSRVRKLPILLFDIMDTVVRDPFYHDIPAFFGYYYSFGLFYHFSSNQLIILFSPNLVPIAQFLLRLPNFLSVLNNLNLNK